MEEHQSPFGVITGQRIESSGPDLTLHMFLKSGFDVRMHQ